MLAAWRFPCCVMEALSDRCEPRGIIYSVVRNQDSWTHGVYSTLLSCCPLKSMELNYIVYVAFTQSPRVRLEPADGQLCLLLYFSFTCDSISRKKKKKKKVAHCVLVFRDPFGSFLSFCCSLSLAVKQQHNICPRKASTLLLSE